MRAMRILLAIAILSSMPACGGGDDPPPPPPPQPSTAQVIDACQVWSHIVVTRFAECLGWDQAMLDAELADGDRDCIDNVQAQADSCHQVQLDSFNGCADRAPTYSCDELCPDGSCFILCSYVCPQ